MYKSKFSENNTDDSRTVIESKGVSYLPLDFSSDSSEEVETQKSYNPLDLLFGNLDSFSNSSAQGVTFNGYNPRYSDLDFHSMWNTEQTDSGKNTSTDINFQGTSKKTFTKEEFKTMLLPVYELALETRGLDKSFARPLVAQDGLETRWGNATIGQNNYGNITGKSGVTRNVPEYINNEWTDKNQTFVNFSSVWDYVNAKIDLLSKSRYDVFNHPINEFAQRVKAGGYATAPNYADVLNNVIRTLRKGGILKFQKGGYEKDLASYISPLPVGNLVKNILDLRSKHGKSSDNYLYEKELERQIKLRGQLVYEDGTTYTGNAQDTLRTFKEAIKPYESQLKNSTSRERWDFIESVKNKNTKKYHLENGKAWREYIDPDNLLNKFDTDSIYRMLHIIYGPPTDFTQYAKRGAKIHRYRSGGKDDELHSMVRQWASDKNGALRYALNHGEKYPMFYQLLRDPNRPYLDLGNGEHGTHKLSYVENDGRWFIYPTIQWEKDSNGEWVGKDYDTENDWRIGWDNAFKNGDYLEIPSEEMARYFTENYKTAFDPNWYPGINDAPQHNSPFTKLYHLMQENNNTSSWKERMDNTLNTIKNSKQSNSVAGFNNAQNVYNHILKYEGSNPYIASGLTAVFMQESGLNHDAVNPKSGASGIAQLLGARRKEYLKWLNGRPDTWENQLDWVWDKVNYGKDDWQEYYNELQRRVRAGIPLSDTEASHWRSMEKSKYVNYSFQNYRDTIGTMTNPGDIAELFTWTFERPGEQEAHIDQRRNYAQSVYNTFNNVNNIR